MTGRTALVVVSHHRPDSLTAHIGSIAAARLKEAGYTVDLLDLHAEGFDPRMNSEDQPDWDDRDKVYSAEARAHMARVLAQGDFRPMAGNDEAMDDLKRILASREALYGKADAMVDTSGETPEQSFAKLLDAVIA